jgi:hypothetical protein
MIIHSQILSQNLEQSGIAPRGADATKNTVLLKGGGGGRTVPVLWPWQCLRLKALGKWLGVANDAVPVPTPTVLTLVLCAFQHGEQHLMCVDERAACKIACCHCLWFFRGFFVVSSRFLRDMLLLYSVKSSQFFLLILNVSRQSKKAGLIKIRKQTISNQFIIPLQRGPVPSSMSNHHPFSRGGGFGRELISLMSARPVAVTFVPTRWQCRK